ncbi:MAG: A/G-specific adenine glycosylase [Candidatus Magnetomorum sp.]|nr:A/G-specific adenine glycosylase [Candidatus Magnetomorum sp.]
MTDIPKNLLIWFKSNKRDLPWRRVDDPYAIWVSEVMLQQTQVNTVIPYYHRFMEQFPTIMVLAQADQNHVLKCWEGLGYYSRAINLHKSSRLVENEYNGQVPSDPITFKKMPGVGDYINAAVQSIAFNYPLPVVDGNVKRVLSRLYEMPDTVNDTKNLKVFNQKAAALLDKKHPGDFNQAMMELGAMVCKPRHPVCHQCPVQDFCMVYCNETILEFPKRKSKPGIPTENWVAAVIQKEDKILLTRRKTGGFLGGLWEFPGGKIENKASMPESCLRSIQEKINIDISIRKHAIQIKHTYTHFKQTMDVFLCDYQSGTIQLNGPVEYRWIGLSDIDNYALPKSNLKFLAHLKYFFKKKS